MAGEANGVTRLPLEERPRHGCALEQGLANGLYRFQADKRHVSQHDQDIVLRQNTRDTALQRCTHAGCRVGAVKPADRQARQNLGKLRRMPALHYHHVIRDRQGRFTYRPDQGTAIGKRLEQLVSPPCPGRISPALARSQHHCRQLPGYVSARHGCGTYSSEVLAQALTGSVQAATVSDEKAGRWRMGATSTPFRTAVISASIEMAISGGVRAPM